MASRRSSKSAASTGKRPQKTTGIEGLKPLGHPGDIVPEILDESLIVNPYHVEETADALHRAATMPPAEQRARMASLRATVREFNVFRWAGRMLTDAGRWRLKARVDARVARYRQAGDNRDL